MVRVVLGTSWSTASLPHYKNMQWYSSNSPHSGGMETSNPWVVFCMGAKETSEHVILCQHPNRRKWRLCSISKLGDFHSCSLCSTSSPGSPVHSYYKKVSHQESTDCNLPGFLSQGSNISTTNWVATSFYRVLVQQMGSATTLIHLCIVLNSSGQLLWWKLVWAWWYKYGNNTTASCMVSLNPNRNKAFTKTETLDFRPTIKKKPVHLQRSILVSRESWGVKLGN